MLSDEAGARSYIGGGRVQGPILGRAVAAMENPARGRAMRYTNRSPSTWLNWRPSSAIPIEGASTPTALTAKSRTLGASSWPWPRQQASAVASSALAVLELLYSQRPAQPPDPPSADDYYLKHLRLTDEETWTWTAPELVDGDHRWATIAVAATL